MIALFVSVDLGGPVYCLSLEEASLCGRVPLQSLVPAGFGGVSSEHGQCLLLGGSGGQHHGGRWACAGETEGGS